MRWILLLLGVAGFALAFTTKSPNLLGFGLIVGLGSLFAFVFSLAAARISETAQPETALIVDPEVNSLRARARQAREGKTKSIAATPRGANNGSGDDAERSS